MGFTEILGLTLTGAGGDTNGLINAFKDEDISFLNIAAGTAETIFEGSAETIFAGTAETIFAGTLCSPQFVNCFNIF